MHAAKSAVLGSDQQLTSLGRFVVRVSSLEVLGIHESDAPGFPPAVKSSAWGGRNEPQRPRPKVSADEREERRHFLAL
jgi:hypothetical protein